MSLKMSGVLSSFLTHWFMISVPIFKYPHKGAQVHAGWWRLHPWSSFFVFLNCLMLTFRGKWRALPQQVVFVFHCLARPGGVRCVFMSGVEEHCLNLHSHSCFHVSLRWLQQEFEWNLTTSISHILTDRWPSNISCLLLSDVFFFRQNDSTLWTLPVLAYYSVKKPSLSCVVQLTADWSSGVWEVLGLLKNPCCGTKYSSASTASSMSTSLIRVRNSLLSVGLGRCMRSSPWIWSEVYGFALSVGRSVRLKNKQANKIPVWPDSEEDLEPSL